MEKLIQIKTSPSLFADEHFSKLINDIDICAETALGDQNLDEEQINEINGTRDKMIEMIKKHEHDCMNRLSKKSVKEELMNKFDFSIKEIEAKIEDLKKIDIELFTSCMLNHQAEVQARHLENRIENKLIEFKKEIFLDKSLIFKENNKNTKYEKSNTVLFGNLIYIDGVFSSKLLSSLMLAFLFKYFIPNFQLNKFYF